VNGKRREALEAETEKPDGESAREIPRKAVSLIPRCSNIAGYRFDIDRRLKVGANRSDVDNGRSGGGGVRY